MSFCLEAALRAAMTDAEFWDYVFNRQQAWDDDYWSMNGPDVWAIECARCGGTVEVDDPDGRERDAFCDDCASEMLPDTEDTR